MRIRNGSMISACKKSITKGTRYLVQVYSFIKTIEHQEQDSLLYYLFVD